jgi:hypothetical protein
MSGMFSYAISLNQGISLCDVSNVQAMYWMFDGAISFNKNLCSWGEKSFPYNATEGIFDQTAPFQIHLSWNKKDLSVHPNAVNNSFFVIDESVVY